MRCDLFACCWMGSHGVPLPVPCHVPQTSRGVVSVWGQGQVVCSRLWGTETEFKLGCVWLSTWWHPSLRHAECFQLLHAVNPSSSLVCITHLPVLILLGFKVCIETPCIVAHGASCVMGLVRATTYQGIPQGMPSPGWGLGVREGL